MMTLAPSLASSRADSSPIPAVPPVTTAMWSISSIGLTFSGRLVRRAGHARGHPVAEAGGVDGHLFAVDGGDAAVVEQRAVITGLRIGHHLACIARFGKAGPDEVVHAELLGAGNVDHPVDRLA